MILLHLLSTFDHSSAGRQVALLAPALQSLALPARLDTHVAALGPDGPFAKTLQPAGVPVHILGTGRRFDIAAFWKLRRLLRELRPDVIHAWRLPALRAAGLLRSARRVPFRLIVSQPLRGGQTHFDQWLLRSADAVCAQHAAEADAVRRLGVKRERIHQLPSAVLPPAAHPPPLGLPLPADAKMVMCIGNLRPGHGFRDAVWAADILRYPIPNLHLVLIGDGPERPSLMRFARGINPAGGHAHFLPARPDAAAMLAHADVVWVPSRSECGRQVALEAMAAGRPVVATAEPGSADLIDDGHTGLLVRSGDPLELARRSRPLFEDSKLARRIGEAGRKVVAELTPKAAAVQYAGVYQAVVGAAEA